jgi:hypothetical protein
MGDTLPSFGDLAKATFLDCGEAEFASVTDAPAWQFHKILGWMVVNIARYC